MLRALSKGGSGVLDERMRRARLKTSTAGFRALAPSYSDVFSAETALKVGRHYAVLTTKDLGFKYPL